MADFRDSIDIAAAPETVFDYLVTNDGMTAWMGQYADLHPTLGGRFAVDIAGHPVRGEYLQIDRPNCVVVSWGFEGSDDLPAGASTVEFRLTPINSGTRVDLCHSDLPDSEVSGHAYGWANFLPRLAVVGAGGKDAYRGFIAGFAPMLTGIGISPSSPTGITSHCFTTRRPLRPPQLPPPSSSQSRAGRSRRAY